MVIERINLYPDNEPGNQVHIETVEGDFNLLNGWYYLARKKMERDKESYLFRVSKLPHTDEVSWNYYLHPSEIAAAKKLIPDFIENQ